MNLEHYSPQKTLSDFVTFKKNMRIKKCPKKRKKSKRGGRVSSENQKVHNSKCGLFDKRWWGQIFRFFPNVNVDFRCLSWTKNNLVLNWFLGNFKCFKPNFFRRVGVHKFKISPISNFSQIRNKGGGSSNFQFFPNSKKSKTSCRRGEGSRKLWTFFHFLQQFLIWKLL